MTAEMSVAITGHRPNRMHVGSIEIERQLAGVLTAIRSGSAGRRRVAISALAEGSDRLFAAVALRLGYSLSVLLPFSTQDYETTFSEGAGAAMYRHLLKQADTRVELPGSLDEAEAAYEAVGRATVDAADILVAVWDGMPAAGRGGTPEIIAYALHEGVPVIWIDAHRLRRPRLLHHSMTQGYPCVPLYKLASRPAALTKRKLKRLAIRV